MKKITRRIYRARCDAALSALSLGITCCGLPISGEAVLGKQP